ncbi:MAG: C10 family peptidase [Bacteroidales bacterium]|jgi:hypothetical protein|nr:C10 family peptidase [Bacteroidales bacterium]
MKRKYLYAVALVLLFSCQKQNLTNSEKALFDQKSYVIPLEEALAEMYDFFDELSPSKDKSKYRKEQKLTVTTIYFDKAKRKASAVQASKSGDSFDELLYVVNFDNNEGFAVLAADCRIPETVIAIAEEGYFNPESLLIDYTNHSIDEELVDFEFYCPIEDDYYVGVPNGYDFPGMLIHEYAVMQVVGGKECDCGGGGSGTTIAPMLTEEMRDWDQHAPYNYFCKTMLGNQAPVGCVPLALGMIMAHNGVPHNMAWGPYTAPWSSIREYQGYPPPPSSNVGNTLASMLSIIGSASGTIYTQNWGLALPQKAKNYLSSMPGYKNVAIHKSYKYDHTVTPKIINMLRNNKPVFVAAVGMIKILGVWVVNPTDGHAWVIDGVQRSTHFHCVWGWGAGDHNGLYAIGIFNPKYGNDPRDDFKRYFRVITYDL